MDNIKNAIIKPLSLHESAAISYLRIWAFLCIITCHFLQYYENNLAWVLNIGVQIFLAISGILYGRKDIGKPMAFYNKRIVYSFYYNGDCSCVYSIFAIGQDTTLENYICLYFEYTRNNHAGRRSNSGN